jgi:phosphatidylinositol 4-kinase type 2
MFARQMAVIKGQAWNVLQSLRHPDEGKFGQIAQTSFLTLLLKGPLELTRRVKILIWDDEIEVGESFSAEEVIGPMTAAPTVGFNPFNRGSPTRPRRIRSISSPRFDAFPPPSLTRSSSDLTGASRPVPFSSKVTRVNPSATGVSVLEHMERLDRVEEGLKRLGDPGNEILYEDPEDEVATAVEDTPLISETHIVTPSTESIVKTPEDPAASTSKPASGSGTPLPNGKPRLSGLGDTPRPSVRMSEEGTGRSSHIRWASHGTGTREGRSGRSMDVTRTPLRDEEAPKKMVIAEVRNILIFLTVYLTSFHLYVACRDHKHERVLFLLVIYTQVGLILVRMIFGDG